MSFAPPMAWGQGDWMHAKREAQFLLGEPGRQPPMWSPKSLLHCLLWPLLLFCYVYYWSFGSWRFYNWKAAIVLCLPLALALCIGSTAVARLNFKRHLPCSNSFALCACFWLALVGGFAAGDRNYGHNMISFYTYQDLVSYTDVNPSKSKGQSYMDAGEVYFKEGTSVSTADMVEFQSRTKFCAAPIVGQPIHNQKGALEVRMEGDVVIPESGTIDFWAVGTDCCDHSTRDFSCGQVSNVRARSGMRMVREDHRPFYLLAVQEWTARMCPTTAEDNTANGKAKAAPLICLPARHPLFFTWVEDPVREVAAYYEQAYQHFKIDAVTFVAFDVFLAFGALYVLRELGFK
eukprot:TRINITY_DN107272_c0_g1_i1.p1 TRINITY_DN107272_c0_g1~~TRINITY_DN107272_c0_g1_i1.p1  ORF type:complete len:347 (+),score=69.00 TRINITY_DN107272_c0_g1_i1:149-1189(+)